MKRKGNLIEKIADIDNLRIAFLKARKGKWGKNEVIKFGENIDKNLLQLRTQLLLGDVEVGRYHFFKIFDPKERQICAASFSERVLQHAIMNVCHSIFENHQIHNSYACRKGKGTFRAVEAAKSNQSKYKWFLKLDFSKYFDSIDQSIVFEQIKRLIKDNQLIAILEKIIFSRYTKSKKGVPIGNLTSQYFANHYLTNLDRMIIETLKIGNYIRYMDDLVLWDNDKERLKQAFKELKQYADSELRLTFKPLCLNNNSHGLPFLGFLIFPDKILMSNARKSRFLKKNKVIHTNFLEDKISEQNLCTRLMAMNSFAEKSQSWHFRTKVIEKYWTNIEGFEPCNSWRQLEQLSQQLPCIESEQQQSGQQEQQHRVSFVPPPA